MKNSPSHDIILYLVASGIGIFGGNSDWSLHDGGLPDKPANAIGIASSGGIGPDTDQLDIFQPSIQVLTCSLDKKLAYDYQERIRALLINVVPVVTPTSRFTQIDMSSEILDIGRDQIMRYVWSANYRTRRVLT